jgi:hypothetical protein
MMMDGSSIKYDIIFYNKGVLTDLRYLHKNEVSELETLVKEYFRAGQFETITFSFNIMVISKYGMLHIDAQDDEDLRRFEDIWTFPNLKKLSSDWSIMIKEVERKNYDKDGNQIYY